ncbi:MAG TPA: HEAT repeat domain-containing protein [Acidobacteriaceae bacterium]|jgi:HEAT repeat protein|nr:HEAT repeat domain-containing protein [Acidobacteriaceae bacterium]
MKVREAVVLILAAAVIGAPWQLSAEQPQPLPAGNGSSAASDDAGLYADGTRAINESRWSDAAGLFDRVAQMRGEHAEGALYWKAYAENKEGQQASALSTCGELRRRYPQSRWLGECGALEIEIRGRSGDPVPPQAEPDENLKLLALSALMQQDQAQAVPILEKILSGNQPEELKSRALFVLAQSRSPQAEALISQIAHGQSGPALQIKAIRMLAAAQGRGANDTLADIYQRSTDAQVKRAVLQSYLITGDSAKLLSAVRQETDPDLVKAAVQTLGAMSAGQDLLTLYRSTNSAGTKADIINALIASGHNGVAPLTSIAQSEPDAELRRKAIRNLGIAGGASVAPALVSTYQSNADVETKRAAAQALFLANDAHDLVFLARAEKNPEMKQYLVQQLSLMHSQEATQYMLEILNK